jgi:cupin 2 domain-containing protein
VTSDRGKLSAASAAPLAGERVEVLAHGEGWRIEQILSGRLVGPVDDLLDHEEWVVVLAGSAVLDVEGVTENMETGDWILLRPGVPHTVVSTEPGTSWLAVHIHAPGVESAR